MDYTGVFANNATKTEILGVFSKDFDKTEFTKSLNHAAAHLWTGPEKTASSTGRFFCYGVSHFVNVMNTEYENKHERENEADNKNSEKRTPSASSGDLSRGPESPESFTEVGSVPPKVPEFALGETENDYDEGEDEDEDGEDITNLSNFQRKPNPVAEPAPQPVDFTDSVDVTDTKEAKTFTDIDMKLDSNGLVHPVQVVEKETPNEDLTEVSRNIAIGQIAEVLTIWFAGISKQAAKNGKDAFSVIFGPPGSGKSPTDSHLLTLLTRIKSFIETAIERNDLERADSLRKLIILIHEILHALFVALSLQSGQPNSNDVLVVKSLLFCFFQVDFAESLQALLDRTTGKRFHGISGATELGNLNIEDSVPTKKPELRLSYETVMKIYGIYLSLANCPIDLLLVDKVSLSLDITTPEDTSPNTYTHFLELLDFSDDKVFDPMNNRFISHLAAIFNYYYELSPDLLKHSLRHSSFFGWVTANTLSWGSYLSIGTSQTSFSNIKLDRVDPFLYEVDVYEHSKRLSRCKSAPESEISVKSPSYLAISFQILQLLHNKTFTKELCTSRDADIELLDIWLCVSSYIHHYQYKSPVNSFGAKVSLLVLLKLTSQSCQNLEVLRGRKIDENKWKLCHHRHPVIPLDESSPKKDALLYIIDVVQVTLRYNLSKKLDLENAKMALTVLYQILLELEANPTDGLHTYAWGDLYSALIKFLSFTARTQNDEGVKFVIEEIFSIFQLLLSAEFGKILEKSSDFFSLGYHPAKSMNFDLLYIMLQQREHLEGLFDKFIKKRTNFDRVEKAFFDFKAKLSSISTTELNHNDVTRILNELSFVGDGNALTSIKIESFNYAETFKYLAKYKDYTDFDKQPELIKAFISILETDWITDSSRRG